MAARLSEDPGDVGPSRSVVDRTMAIIGTFQGECDRQSLSGLSRRSGLPVATSYRIVQRLTAWGALERDDDGKYRIGLRLWEVASLAPRSMGLQAIARPHMQELYEATHSNVQLAIREGRELVSIEYFRDPARSTARPRVGRRYGLHTTAIGLVLLAYAPEAIQAEILSGKLYRFTEFTYCRRAELARALETIRQRGYAVSDRQVDLVHIGVAAPVFAADGAVIAALSLVRAHDGADVTGMVHAVRRTASGISRALRESDAKAAL